MLRGIEKRPIFLDDLDRHDFLSRLSRVLPRSQTRCLAWALLPNHVHLVLRTTAEPLAAPMASLNTGYALHFNRKYDRVGHLFQNRFRSRVVNEDADLLGVVLYVSGNPLRHGVAKSMEELEQLPWCSYGALSGHMAAQPFHQAADALALFGPTVLEARSELRRWMTERWRLAMEVNWDGNAAEPPDTGESLDRLIEATCREFGASRKELTSGLRTTRVSAARAVIAHLAAGRGWSLVDLAPHLGVSSEALCQARRRGKDLLSQRDDFLVSEDRPLS